MKMRMRQLHIKPIVNGVFCFPRELISDAEYMTHESALTYKTMSGERFGFGEAQELCLLQENKNTGLIEVPRRYAYSNFDQSILNDADIQLSEGSNIDIVFNNELQGSRPELKERQDLLIKDFFANLLTQKTPFKEGTFCARCGTGKTVVALKVSSELGRTTLVLVHKEFLVEQWVERILQFTDATESDIGYVQQKKCDYEGKKFVIAMVQSLMRESKYPSDFYTWPGVVIADEAHRMSAPCFSEAAPKFPAKYRIGVTATPRRGDGLEDVFEHHLGKVMATMRGGNEIIPKVYQIPFKSWYPDNMYIWKDKKGKIVKLFLAKLINLLVANDKRTEWIVKEIKKAASSGRKVLVLSDRLEHLDHIQRLLDVSDCSFSVGKYIGGMKKRDRELSSKCDIVLSTYKMAKEGLDVVQLDTLFLATPKSDVEQSVGRILRYDPDKKEPLVVDIVDTITTCLKFAQKRLIQYKRLGYNIEKSV